MLRRCLLLTLFVLVALKPAYALEGCPEVRVLKDQNSLLVYYGLSSIAFATDPDTGLGLTLFEQDHGYEVNGQLLQAAVATNPGEYSKLYTAKAFWDPAIQDYIRIKGVYGSNIAFVSQFNILRLRTTNGHDVILVQEYNKSTLFTAELFYDQNGSLVEVEHECVQDQYSEEIGRYIIADKILTMFLPYASEGAGKDLFMVNCSNDPFLLYNFYSNCVYTGPVPTPPTRQIPTLADIDGTPDETPPADTPTIETPTGDQPAPGGDIITPNGDDKPKTKRPKRKGKRMRRAPKKRTRKKRKKRS